MPETKTPRQQILELQEQMAADQIDVAKDLAEYIAGEDVANLVSGLGGLRDRTVPQSTLDLQITGFINQLTQLGQLSVNIYQSLLQQQQAQQAALAARTPAP